MGIGVLKVVYPLFAFSDELELSRGELIGIAAVVGAVVLAIIVALVVRMQRRGANPRVDSCDKCGSMSVQNRAGLVVCADCGHSVKTQEAQA